ncbi:MAG TPA: Na/Pi symporter [bacterium]|nr:Na/Pi symporter [bacterium]HQN71815.1 Na/Pi symporter [bacterium]HQO90836.1 Na/Pi symporter [bacterium]
MYQLLLLPAGLAFFLFGMTQLSSMLSGFTGRSFADRLDKWTRSDFTKIFAGFSVTTLFQSSGATTAILVSMTSVGLVTVTSSVSYLIGANIGSITTAWIVAVKVTSFGVFMFTGGFLLKFVLKNEKLKKISLFVAGLGLIFFGLQMMMDSVSFLKENQKALLFFSGFDASSSFISMLILVIAGVVFTAVIHSSGATAAMMIGLVSAGAVSIHSSAAVVLGSTLGTTATAYLASLGTSAEGKRTAFLQIFINVIELFAGLILFYPSVGLVIKAASAYSLNSGFAIALYMTLLKIMLALIVFPLRKVFAGIAERMIRKKFRLITEPFVLSPVKDDDTVEKLRDNFMPAIDLCVKYLTDMLSYSYIGIRKPALRSIYKKVIHYEEIIDEAQKDMVGIISKCRNPNHDTLWLFLKMADELESMGDHAKSIAKYGVRLDEIRHKLSDAQKKILLECYLMVFRQFYEVCVNKKYDCNLVAKGEDIERYLRKEKRKIYSLLCTESDHNYEKRLILVDILSEYSKFNHSVKRILQVNIDISEGKGIYLWESRCKS